MRKSRSDSAIVATICAAAHSTNITCARSYQVQLQLGLPHPQHELQANVFSNLDFDLGCGKSRTRRSRPCAPIVTRPPLHRAAIAEFCDAAVRAITCAANMLSRPNDEACQNMTLQVNFLKTCFGHSLSTLELLFLRRSLSKQCRPPASWQITQFVLAILAVCSTLFLR